MPARRDIQLRVFRHLQELDFVFHTSKSSGSLISLMKRGDSAVDRFSYNLNVFGIRNIIRIVLVLGFMLFFHWTLLLTALLIFVLSAILMYWNIRNNYRRYQEWKKTDDQLSGVVVDCLTNFDTVKYFSGEAWEEKRLRKHSQSWLKKMLYFANSYRRLDLTNGLLIDLSYGIMTLVALWQYNQGNISLGEVVSVFTVTILVFGKVIYLLFNLRDAVTNYSDSGLLRHFGQTNCLARHASTYSREEMESTGEQKLARFFFAHLL